jgi:prepilin-type N-terminal cleavage/methylation domain-containing protein
MMQRGLTMNEMLVTLAITSVLALVTAPSLSRSYSRSQARSIAEMFSQDLTLAKTDALKRNLATRVKFTKNDAGLTTGWTITPTQGDEELTPIRTFDLRPYARIRVSSAAQSIEFSPVQGSVASAQQIRIESDAGCIALEVSPLGFTNIGAITAC